MKYILLSLAILLTPIASHAMPSYQPDHWFCKAVGSVDGQNVVFLTKVWTDEHENDYEKREKKFTERIKKVTKDAFKPSFMSKCRDYVNEKRANKHRMLEIKTAGKYNFKVMEIDWKWSPDDVRKESK